LITIVASPASRFTEHAREFLFNTPAANNPDCGWTAADQDFNLCDVCNFDSNA